jgi:polysaccharide pyruvyl transferase WcaK-like protein
MPKLIQYQLSARKKGIYVGCKDMNNLGDETVYHAIKHLFADSLFLFPVSYKHRDVSLALIKRLKTPDVILLGGGTLISRGPTEGYLKLLLQVIGHFKNSKLLIFGTGVSEPQLALQAGIPTDVSAWTSVLNTSVGIGVRGNLSKKFLLEWNVKREVVVVGDPAIYLGRDLLVRKQKRKKIAVNFCNILGRIHGLDSAPVEQFGRELFRLLLEQEWDIYLFPMASSDNEYMQEKMLVEDVSKVTSFPLTNNSTKALDFLESMDFFVGMRLHAIAFAVNACTPFYAIEYHSKTFDYLEMMGLDKYSIRTDELNAQFVVEQINKLYIDNSNHQDIIFNQLQQRKTQLQTAANQFKKIIS